MCVYRFLVITVSLFKAVLWSWSRKRIQSDLDHCWWIRIRSDLDDHFCWIRIRVRSGPLLVDPDSVRSGSFLLDPDQIWTTFGGYGIDPGLLTDFNNNLF